MSKRKNYGTPIGTVLLHSTRTAWKADVDVLYKSTDVLVLRDWPNTPDPKYFYVVRQHNEAAMKEVFTYMNTLQTGGIVQLPDGVCNDFDKICTTFSTIEENKEKYRLLLSL